MWAVKAKVVDKVTLRKKGVGQRSRANGEEKGAKEAVESHRKRKDWVGWKEEEKPGREGGIWGPLMGSSQ